MSPAAHEPAPVRLVANTSAVKQFLPAELASFVAAQPGTRIQMEETNSREAVLAVLDDRADLGVLADRTPALGLQTLPYRRDRLVLVVPAGHSLAGQHRTAFADAAEFDFVGLTQGSSLARRRSSARPRSKDGYPPPDRCWRS